MFELLEQILNNLDFFTDNKSNSNTDAVSYITESESEVLATSFTGDKKSAPGSKKPKGDCEICKTLTDQVIEMQRNSTFNPLSSLEHADEDG